MGAWNFCPFLWGRIISLLLWDVKGFSEAGCKDANLKMNQAYLNPEGREISVIPSGFGFAYCEFFL